MIKYKIIKLKKYVLLAYVNNIIKILIFNIQP